MKPLSSLIALSALAVVPTSNTLRLAAAVTAGETITIGTTVFEIQTDGHTITTGRTAVDLTGANSATAAAAAKILTFAATPSNNDTVSINAQVYTFKTALTASTTANEVLIGASLTTARDNLVAAVNTAAGGGTTYGSATVINSSVTATATSTDQLTATAKVKGTAGNSIVIAEAAAELSWASAATALSGGVDPTAAEAKAAIITAVNSVNSGMRAVSGTTGEITLVGTSTTGATVACTETLAGTNNAFAAATSYGGYGDQDAIPFTMQVSRAALATDVALGFMRFPVNFTPRAASVRITRAAAPVAWDGAVTLAAGMISLDNTGSTDWQAADVITITASK